MANIEDEAFLAPGRQHKNRLPSALDESLIPEKPRDPSNLHADLNFEFQEVIQIPAHFQTDECHGLFKPDDPNSTANGSITPVVYEFFQKNCYIGLTTVLSVPLSLFWGLWFAVTACMNVWFLEPIKRSQSIKAKFWKNVLGLCISTFCDPFYTSAGKMWTNVNIKTEIERV